MAALGLGPDRVVLDTAAMGFLFESLAIRDLRIYAQALDEAGVYYSLASSIVSCQRL
jgi:hypothetical protein